MKSRSSITIDADLLKTAQERNINVSEVTEKKLKEIVTGKPDTPKEELKCFKCGVKLPRQTADDLTKGLVYLCPEEVWICPKCLKTEISKVPIVIGTRRG